MAAFTAYLEDMICDWLKGVAADAAPASLLLALSTADPLDDGSGLAEPVGFNYSRQAIAFGAHVAANGVGSQMSNTGNILYTASGGAWGIIAFWAIYDNTGTNMLLHGSFATSKNIQDGDSFVVNIGSMALTIR